MKFVINTQHYCGRDANFFFEIKLEKNKLGKECETGCFQSKLTNFVRAEMRRKAEYQTSRGQICTRLSFSFSDLKPSNNSP